MRLSKLFRDVGAEPRDPTIVSAAGGKFPFNRCAVGIEVEVENAAITGRVPRNWRITEDGSLRNGGVEFVSSPLAGGAITNALTSLDEYLKDKVPNHSWSVRTSVHVHVNHQFSTTEQVLKEVLLFIVFEDILFDIFGPDRKDNNHCVKLSDSFIRVKELVESISGSHVDEIFNAISRWPKYTSLNLSPLTRQWTLEYRMCSGTSNPDLLTNFITILQNLKKVSHSTSNMQVLLDTVCPTPDDLWTRVMGSAAMTDQNYHDMIEGARYAQTLLDSFQEPKKERVEGRYELPDFFRHVRGAQDILNDR